jgi:putative phosphoesterase
MKIAVISDIHSNMGNIALAKKIIDEEKIRTVICCGDIQSEEVFRELDSWKQQVYLALGNVDKELERKLDAGLIWPEHLKYYPDYGEMTIAGKKVAFCHFKVRAFKLAEKQKWDIIFYGHTHTPWEEKVGKTILLNPGEITRHFGKPTFAIYDFAKMKAKLVFI